MIGRLGELLVEQKLIEQGWNPVRLDAARLAPNADLVAIKEKHRVTLQVKTTDARKGSHSHSHSFFFGYATGYLREGKSVFNSKPGPLCTDLVVGVRYDSPSRFVVMPVAVAEALCRAHCDYWISTPKESGKTRSPSFPIYLRFADVGKRNVQHDEKMRNALLVFENRWELLSEPVDRLHDVSAWDTHI